MTATETRLSVDDRPRFEEAWVTAKLEAHCSANSGGTPDSKTRAFYGGDVPWASISDITEQGRFLVSTERHLSRLGLARSAAQLWPPGTILYAMYASPGECSISTIEVSSSQAVLGIQCGATVDRDFLYYRLAASKRAITSSIQHGTQANLNKGMVMGLAFSFPTLAEQRAIAAALSDVDDLLQSLNRLIAKKRDVKQGAMQQLLTGATRLPGFEGKWETKALGDLADIRRGASPRPISSPVWFQADSEVGWVRISDLATADRMFLRRTSQRLSPRGIAASRFLDPSTLIMSICASVGAPAITAIPTCIHDGFVAFLRLRDVDQLFLYYKLTAIEKEIQAEGQHGSQSNLNSDIVRGLEVSLPPVPEQRAIAETLSDMDAEIDALERRRAKTVAIKEGMMQELLTGRTRLPIPQEA